MTLLTASKPQSKATEEEAMRDLFDQLGLFSISEFFKPKFCAQLRAEVRQSPSQLAQVIGKGNQSIVNPTVRVTDRVQISPQSWETIEDHLIGLKPQLEQYFKTDLSKMEKPNVLRYHQGSFFRWHTDGTDNCPATKARKVTTLVYLNGSDEESGSDRFIGGELEIYTHDLIPQEEYKAHCLQLYPKTGLLISFSSRIHHQVQPLVRGTRYVISTFWR